MKSRLISRDVLSRFHRATVARPHVTALGLFSVVLAVYLVNPDPFWSGDMNSNSIFPFNVLEFGTIHLDSFIESHLYKSFGGYSFTQAAPNSLAAGHATLSYPVGTAVVTFPLYILFYGYLKIFAPAISPLGAEFEPYRVAFSHIAASMLSAASVTCFFLIVRARFSVRPALVTTACLAFATMQWGLLSQSLFQQGPSSFVIMASAYFLLRPQPNERRAWSLVTAGGLVGLLFMIRPTNLIFMLAFVAFAAAWFGRRSWPFFAGFAFTSVLSTGWNWLYFSSWLGAASIFQTHSYVFTPQSFLTGLLGLTVSPIHGLFANSPVLIFSLVGIVIALLSLSRAGIKDVQATDLLFLLLLGASVVLLASYSFSPFWDGGGSYGTRYVSETMPVLAYFLNFVFARDTPPRRLTAAIFTTFIALGVFNQVTSIVGGQLAFAAWASIPYGTNDLPDDRRWDYMRDAPLRSLETRRWNLRDGLNERIWRGVYANRRMMPPVQETFNAHALHCGAVVESVADNSGRNLDRSTLPSVDGTRPYADRLWESSSGGRKFVHARIRNDGGIPLYGYQTGLIWGFATMTHKVIDEKKGNVVREAGTVYVSGTIQPGETGDALGSMEVSMAKGRYRIEARMAVSGIGYCGPPRALGTIVVE